MDDYVNYFFSIDYSEHSKHVSCDGKTINYYDMTLVIGDVYMYEIISGVRLCRILGVMKSKFYNYSEIHVQILDASIEDPMFSGSLSSPSYAAATSSLALLGAEYNIVYPYMRDRFHRIDNICTCNREIKFLLGEVCSC